MSEARTLAARGSEWCREASVLTLIFGWLDPMVQLPVGASISDRFNAVELKWALLVMAISIVVFGVGLLFDRIDLAASGEDFEGTG